MSKKRVSPASNHKSFEHYEKVYRVGIDENLEVYFQDSPNGTAWIHIGTCKDLEDFDFAVEISKTWIDKGMA